MIYDGMYIGPLLQIYIFILAIIDDYGILYRPVVPGGAEGAMAPPDFGRSVKPISTRRDRLYMPTTLLAAPPDF